MNSNEKKNDSNFTYDMQDAYYYDDATGSFKKRTDKKNQTLPGRDSTDPETEAVPLFFPCSRPLPASARPHLLSASFWISVPFFLRSMRWSGASTEKQRRLVS